MDRYTHEEYQAAVRDWLEQTQNWVKGRVLEIDPVFVEEVVADTAARWVQQWEAGDCPGIVTKQHLGNTIRQVIRFDILDSIDAKNEERPYKPTDDEVIEISRLIADRGWGDYDTTSARDLGAHFVKGPPVRLRYMKRRFDEIRSSQEEQIMRWLQVGGLTVEEVRDKLSVETGRSVSLSYIYAVRARHTWSARERPDLYRKEGQWPAKSRDATRKPDVLQ